jgi:hypothetical protein
MTKHSPSTPLPWTWRTLSGVNQMKDLAYAAHAANAYPKLIEALRKVVAQAQQYPDNAAGVHVDAAILLRELGEGDR